MIRIPSVDVKGLDPGLLRRGRLLNRRRLGLRNKLAAGGGRLADLGERINGSVGSREDRRCREEWPGAGQQAGGGPKGSHGGRSNTMQLQSLN